MGIIFNSFAVTYNEFQLADSSCELNKKQSFMESILSQEKEVASLLSFLFLVPNIYAETVKTANRNSTRFVTNNK